MKTAICCAGTGRCIDHTIDNLKQNLFYDHSTDIYLYLTSTENTDYVKKQFEDVPNINIYTNREDHIPIEHIKFRHNWPPSIQTDYNKGRQIYVQMLRSRCILGGLVNLQSTKYDRILFSRIDVVYEQPVFDILDSLSIDDNTIYVPNFHHWGGINDRFACSTQDGMIDYFNLYNYIDILVKDKHVFHAESTLLQYMNDINKHVKQCGVRFCRIRNGKLHDKFNSLK